MNLAPAVEPSPRQLAELARSHGLDPGAITPLATRGIFNTIYRLGDSLIMRVPRRHTEHFAALEREVIVVPAARTAGVRTPELVAYDPSGEVLPVPYTVYDVADGQPLEREPGAVPLRHTAWRELGRDLRRLHSRAGAGMGMQRLRRAPPVPTAEELVVERTEEGWLSTTDASWMTAWLDVLSARGGTAQPVITHGLVQASNLMVDGARYVALIDWGSAKWDDPAHDFAGVPLGVVPQMLEGYDAEDIALKARILRRHLQLALLLLPRGAVPDLSWAERPVPMLSAVLRSLSVDGVFWSGLGPR